MIPSFSFLESSHIPLQPSNLLVHPPLRHSSRHSKILLPTDPCATLEPVETTLSPSHSYTLAPVVREHISDGSHTVNGHGHHHSPTIRFLSHTFPEFEDLSISVLPQPAHPTTPCGISQETPIDSVSDKHNDGLSLLPPKGQSMKTCGFQTFPSVTVPVAETTGYTN